MKHGPLFVMLGLTALWLTDTARAEPGLSPPVPPALSAGAERALRAFEFTLGLDFDQARAELTAAEMDEPAILLERARLALYEQDCDGASLVLARKELAHAPAAAMLADVARGCARVIASTVVDRDDGAIVEVRYQDQADRVMTPLLIETVVKARDVLTRDLGVTWPSPTRITVVRDLLSLSAMTGLPYDSARTTGTVAVAKWGRVTLLSPRASRHGYNWRDTMAHELTHLAVTRASRDRAPLWLQEGVAKREEIRWRDPGPFDNRPSADVVAQRGIEAKLDLHLDELGPSIAMLASADAAMVAFAEVTSFVAYLAATASLPDLLAALRTADRADSALVQTTGADLKTWEHRWRAHLAGQSGVAFSRAPDFAKPLRDSLKPADLVDLRNRMRLAELLLARENPAQAIAQLDRIRSSAISEDASYRALRARALLLVNRKEEASLLVADPLQVASSYAPWWAIRGRLARDRGDTASADTSFAEAISIDPFDIDAACPDSPLCEAARVWGEPRL